VPTLDVGRVRLIQKRLAVAGNRTILDEAVVGGQSHWRRISFGRQVDAIKTIPLIARDLDREHNVVAGQAHTPNVGEERVF
jgi:hypothetical protein